MHLTAEHRQRLEAQAVVDPLTQARLADIVMPVVLRGEEKEDRVFDLEPLIDYMVFEMQRAGTVRHPCVEGKVLTVEDIEAVTGEGVDEKNGEHVRLVLTDFQADIAGYLTRQRAGAFTEAEVDAKAGEIPCVTEEWKRKKREAVKEDVDAFLGHVAMAYGANFEVGDAKSLHESIQASSTVGGDEHKAYAVLDGIEELLDANVELNVISNYNHDTQTRVYILNPDAAMVERVQKREMAAQQLVVLRLVPGPMGGEAKVPGGDSRSIA
jgi:hypothetical protein